MKKAVKKVAPKKLVFQIEQVALCPAYTKEALKLLKDMGISEFVKDRVVAKGFVFGEKAFNKADLNFNYTGLQKARELEVLDYVEGDNWMKFQPSAVSHFGMHCTAEELFEWRKFFAKRGVEVAQEVMTQSHTNPHIKGKRWYNYVIFKTRQILGVDIKFIVRRDTRGEV